MEWYRTRSVASAAERFFSCLCRLPRRLCHLSLDLPTHEQRRRPTTSLNQLGLLRWRRWQINPLRLQAGITRCRARLCVR